MKKTKSKLILSAIIAAIFIATTGLYFFFTKDANNPSSNISLCTFQSDQEAYHKALETNDTALCACVKDERLNDTCMNVGNDIVLYTQAFDKLDETLCNGIQDETAKESCILAVEDAKAYVETVKKSKEQENVLESSTEIADYEKARDKNPSDVQNLINLARAHVTKALTTSTATEVDMVEINKALATLEEAKAIDSNIAEIYAAEGFLYALIAQNDKAIALYTKCLELDQKNMEALLGRGKIYAHVNKGDKAIADFEKIIEIDTGKYFTNTLVSAELCKLYDSDINTREKKKNICSVALENTKDEDLKNELQKIVDSI